MVIDASLKDRLRKLGLLELVPFLEADDTDKVYNLEREVGDLKAEMFNLRDKIRSLENRE